MIDAILTDCSESLKICKTPSFSRVAPPGHSNGHVSVGTNGHPAGTLFPTDTVRWARPQPKMAFAPLMAGQHLRLVLNPLRPTDRESDTPPDAGSGAYRGAAWHKTSDEGIKGRAPVALVAHSRGGAPGLLPRGGQFAVQRAPFPPRKSGTPP